MLNFEPLEQRTLLAAYVVELLGDVSNGSDGKFTLREAIAEANGTSDADIISFAPALAGGTITLTGQIFVAGNLTMNGLGADQLTVRAGGAHRIFNIFGGASVEISGLTIRDGKTSEGGGISVSGTLALHDTIVTANMALTGGGGGVYVESGGALTVVNSTISENSAAFTGGGIYNTGTLTIANRTIW
jgi:hypothetical protein